MEQTPKNHKKLSCFLLDPMLAHLGSMLAHLGAMLPHLGAKLAHLGPMLVYLGPILAHLDANLAQLGANMVQHRPKMASILRSPRQKARENFGFCRFSSNGKFHENLNKTSVFAKFCKGRAPRNRCQIGHPGIILAPCWGLKANSAPRRANLASRWANIGPR